MNGTAPPITRQMTIAAALTERPMTCVLVVEDEAQVRILAEAIIQDSGRQTVSAANFAEALALLQGDMAIEMLFTDINLVANGPNGLDLAAEARAIRPELSVL
jgi:CheY-like chemotaxis protein